MCKAEMSNLIDGTNVAKKKKGPTKYMKAPDAPRRFKSAFIFFSTEKHKEIRSKLGDKGNKEKTTNVAKMVSEAWKNLSAEEREYWDEKARSDKERFELEKRLYDGPWKVPAQKSTKDPNAPKRPMSAFLAYSNSKRSAVKRDNTGLTNAEVSRVLASMWKCADEEEKKFYIDQEFTLRQNYKTRIAEWRANEEKEKEIQRNVREEMTLRTIEAHRRQLEDMNNSSGEVMQRQTDNLPILQVPPYLAARHEVRDRGGEYGRMAVSSHHHDESLEYHQHLNNMDQHLAQPPSMQGSMMPSYGTYNHDAAISSMLGSSGFNSAQSLYDHQQTLISNLQQQQQQEYQQEYQQWGSNVYNSRHAALLNAFAAQNQGTGHRYATSAGRYHPDAEYHHNQFGRDSDFNNSNNTNNFFDQSGPY